MKTQSRHLAALIISNSVLLKYCQNTLPLIWNILAIFVASMVRVEPSVTTDTIAMQN